MNLEFRHVRTMPGPYRPVGGINIPNTNRVLFSLANVFAGAHNTQIIDQTGKRVDRGLGDGAETMGDPVALGPHLYWPMEHGSHTWTIKPKGQALKRGPGLGGGWAIASCRYRGGVVTAVNNEFKGKYFTDNARIVAGSGKTVWTVPVNIFPHSMCSSADRKTLFHAASFCEQRKHFGLWRDREQVYAGDIGVVESIGDDIYALPGGTSTMWGERSTVDLTKHTPDGKVVKRWRLKGKRGVDLYRVGRGLWIMVAQPFAAYIFDPDTMAAPQLVWEKDPLYVSSHRSFGAYFAYAAPAQQMYICHAEGSHARLLRAQM